MLKRDNCRLQDGQEKSYGISQKFLIVVAVFCDYLSLPSFSSSRFSRMCESVQPSKWRLQKKGKPSRDPIYCSLSPSNLEKLYVVSPPGGRGLSGHTVHSGGSSPALHCSCVCTWRGERTICRISCSLVPLSVALSLQPGGSSCTSLQKVSEQRGSGTALAMLYSKAVLRAEHQPTSEQTAVST